MKPLLRRLLAWYLGLLAGLVVARKRPYVVAVAGTVNKAFTVASIARQLETKGIQLEMTPHHFNTDIGLPLALLGLPSGYNSYRAWLSIIPKALKALKRPLGGVLVLEFGINRPGDMRRLLRIVRPQAAVITDITQRDRENFGGLDQLAAEYGRLVKAVPVTGSVVLNYDTILVRGLAASAIAPVRYISMQPDGPSEVIRADAAQTSAGISGTIIRNGSAEAFDLPRFGRHHVFAYLFALAVSDAVPVSQNHAFTTPQAL